MFTDLFTLVQQTPVSLLITAVGQELRIIITPHCSKADDLPLQAEQGLLTQLSLQGTPAELDVEFATAIAHYKTSRSSLAQQVEATTAILEAAKQASVSSATKALKKGQATPKALPAPTPEADPDDNDDDGLDGAAQSVVKQPTANSPVEAPPELSLF